ncbi:MAG: sigma factor [Chloroflexota bacterium]|nr:sigma factor [Chloroflexota bacterium]
MTDILTNALEGQSDLAAPTGDDETLAREATENPAAFAELYRRHLSRVYRYLLVRVGDVHDAQDLTAQTFLRRWRASLATGARAALPPGCWASPATRPPTTSAGAGRRCRWKQPPTPLIPTHCPTRWSSNGCGWSE